MVWHSRVQANTRCKNVVVLGSVSTDVGFSIQSHNNSVSGNTVFGAEGGGFNVSGSNNILQQNTTVGVNFSFMSRSRERAIS